MSKQVFIHAGAHRTGTSSFQLCLHENRTVLTANGYDLAYPGRDGVPQGRLRLKLPRPRAGEKRIPEAAKRVRTHLSKLSPNAERALILSEENIPGAMRPFYSGQFFPASAKRFAALARALDGPPVHVIYVLRSYAQLYVSAFRKRSEDNAMVPFDEVVPKFLEIDRGWPELLADMRDILKPAQITVLPYERRGSSRELLTKLVPDLQGKDLSEPQETMNLSATDAALIAVQARLHGGETLAESQWRRVIADHADDREPRGYAAFNPADTAILDARYQRDQDRVSDMDGITFI